MFYGGSRSPLEDLLRHREEAERAMEEKPGIATAILNWLDYKAHFNAAVLKVELANKRTDSLYTMPDFNKEYNRDLYRGLKATFSGIAGKFSGVKEEIKEEVDHIKTAIEEPPQYGQGVA